MRVAKPVELNADDDRRLRILCKRKRVEARVQMRARIVPYIPRIARRISGQLPLMGTAVRVDEGTRRR